MKPTHKHLLWFAIAPLICISLTAFKGDERNFRISKHLDIFHAVFRELDLCYVDTLDVAKVVDEGIHAMVSSLDPYTVYYPEEEDEDLKMMITGKYAGVGAIIRYHKRHDRVVIVEPYEGMPADWYAVLRLFRQKGQWRKSAEKLPQWEFLRKALGQLLIHLLV